MKTIIPPLRRVLPALAVFAFILASCGPQQATLPALTLMPTSVPATQVPPTVPPPTAAPSETSVPPEATPTQPAPQDAQAFPDPTGFEWQMAGTGFAKPTDLADPGDGTGRLLIVEQRGVIWVLGPDGQTESQPFLDLTDRVGPNSSEQGLLGIALDPQFAENGIFYLNYTDLNGDSKISRFGSIPGELRGDPGSEQILLSVDQPYANHNGGDLEWGPDGYLYIGLGDGGSGGDPQGNAQNNNTLLGKMLRIDVRGQPTYAIPADNPFASGNGRQEIWANGLRNPWRYSFDSLTGDLFIADVGQNQYEEVSFLPAGSPAGANFGWDYREGRHEYEGRPPAGLEMIDPVFEYAHDQGCSITGGYVYRGLELPEFYGIYLVGDYCNGFVWGLLRGADGQWQSQRLFQVSGNISSFGQDAAGELYLLDHRTGSVFKLVRR